ncbi:tRNA dimethylallyltransferase 9 isoform X2 [Physcomitrium patens]|uniref:tRNA dimethylallyltransferase 9 isoform X2 n=1 Tax=Physcomitrium patens TaxID=3218 RepID=UPI000D176C15|nr:tRNA dimethylallyltransferase 9-like isoform X2 [Physcomitrium patens]|eukprot:XP_024398392.1 tRNA dimethylallyltransferase 9-like isoform X2 [Physcomitrella patens]
MRTSRACPFMCSRGWELVAQGNNERKRWEEWWSCRERIGVESMVKKKVRLVVRANVTVEKSDKQVRLLTEAGGAAGTLGCLELSGRLDTRSNGKVTSLGTQRGRVVVIAGPTAVGKSRVAIALAKQLRGEIISADSIQVYKGMNVGSAKTPLLEREGVPHHLLDMISPMEEYSASRFLKDARAATKMVLDSGHVPIVVGGTCTYLHWYMNGEARAPKPSPKSNAANKERIERLVDRPGDWEFAVHTLAQAGDPATAYSLCRNDWPRLRRALEGILISGQSGGVSTKPHNYTLDNMDIPEWDYDYDFQCYFLYQNRAELYRWIDLRCEQMIAEPQGLLQEASWLLDLGLLPNTSSASRGIGYQEWMVVMKQAMEFLVECRGTGGITTEEKFLAFLSGFQHVSRSLVKKQLRWFRSSHDSAVKQFHWIDASQPTDQILEALRAEYLRRPGYPSELKGSNALIDASYKEGKTLKYYDAKNRIFTSSSTIAPVLRWVKKTQGDLRPIPRRFVTV